jgi:hypothetical protein
LQFTALCCKSLIISGAGEGNRTLVNIQVKVGPFLRLFGAAARGALAALIQNSQWQFAPLGNTLRAMTRPDIGESNPPQEEQRRWFTTAHWSVVLAAKEGNVSRAAAELEKLCRTYWPPLYAYIRREGHDATEAQDLTQEFFARLLAKDYLQNLRHQQGKFRSFLLAYLKNFLLEQGRKVRALKRGSGQVFVSLDTKATALRSVPPLFLRTASGSSPVAGRCAFPRMAGSSLLVLRMIRRPRCGTRAAGWRC